MLSDLRDARRALLREPGFTTIAVLTLALAIGANVAVLGLVRAVVLEPLPYGDPGRLVAVWERRGGSRDASLPLSGHEYAALAADSAAFDGATLFHGGTATLTGAGEPEAVGVLRTAADYFRVHQLAPALGRVFADGEDRPPAHVAVLSDALWRRRFAADPRVIGQSFLLDEQPYVVIGVMPPLPRSLAPDVWLPLDLRAQLQAVGRHSLSVVARLAPGITMDRARAHVNAIAMRLEADAPGANTGHRFELLPIREQIAGDVRAALLALLAAVGCVMLIATANVAGLLLTRGAKRQHEIAVRLALGAGRFRVARQLLLESLVIAGLGGAAGVLLAAWILDLVPTLTAVRIPLAENARLDWIVAGGAAVLSILTGAGAGLAPAMRGSRTDAGWLRDGSRLSASPSRQRGRMVLVSVQVALTLVLLVGAGLLINSFVRLTSVRPGFEPHGVLVFGVDLASSRYADAEQRRAFFDRLLAGVRSIPAVEAAGAVSQLPLGGADNWMPFSLEGRPAAAPGQEPNAAFRVATPEYFKALRIPLRRGRLFTEADGRLALPLVRWFEQQPHPAAIDRPQPPPVAVVSEAAVQQFWPGEDPIGRRIRVLFSSPVTIVGVVGDIRHNSLALPAYPHVYLAHNQEPWGSLSVVVRAAGDQQPLESALREQVRALDPTLPFALRHMEDVLGDSVGRPRFYALFTGLFGAVALALSVIGIFGLVSYAAAQRRRELGVRLALGARPREIVGLVVGQGMRPIAVGIAVGAAAALALTRFMQSMLFAVDAADPLTFAAVALLLAVSALAACWIPARRAAAVDPMTVLRAE